MPQTNSRFFDDLSRLMTDAAGLADGAKREAQTFARSQMERMMAGMNVVTREEFEAGNRDIVWKAMPDISIELTPFLADGELIAYRGLGQGTHTGAELFGIPPAGKHVTFTETHIIRIRGNQVCEHWLQVDLLGLLGQLRS